MLTLPSDELIKAMVCDTGAASGVDSTCSTLLLLQSALTVPTTITGRLNSLLGEPVGFMLVMAKKELPYMLEVEMQFSNLKDLAKSWSTWVLGAVTVVLFLTQTYRQLSFLQELETILHVR